MARGRAGAPFAALSEQRREQAMVRFALLRSYLEEGAPLIRAAGQAGVPLRTAERWLARCRQDGLADLARPARPDPAMATVARDGPAAFRDRHKRVHRHHAAPRRPTRSGRPTTHTLPDLLVLGEAGRPARPWLATVVDDHSRAIAEHMVSLGVPAC